MSANQAKYPVVTMCRVLEVSTSGYYAWRTRAPSARAVDDTTLTEQIQQIHEMSWGTYGAPRIHAELRAQGVAVGRDRVSRLMRLSGIEGVTRRRFKKTTQRDRDARRAPDLVEWDFSAKAPDQLWIADVSYIPTWAGFLYLAVVIDVLSRRVVGWSMASHLRAELVMEALNMAIWQRRPVEVIHHSDQGSQTEFKGSSQRWLDCSFDDVSLSLSTSSSS